MLVRFRELLRDADNSSTRFFVSMAGLLSEAFQIPVASPLIT